MIYRFKQQKYIYKLITLAVLAAAIFFVCRIAYAGIRSLPYSREFLEPSNVALTNTFLEGRSPYTLSSLYWDEPGINYDYPFLNSLLAAALAKITGFTAVSAHLMISFICIVASGVIGALMVKDHTKSTVAPVITAILFMFCHWRFGFISAAPDDLGLFLMMLTLYLAVNRRVPHKPIWCAIGITLCFYTKQYFIFVAVSIFIYMLLYSWKETLKLFVWTVLINTFVAVVVTIYWPLFWMRTIAFTYLGTAYGGGGELITLIEQLDYLAFPFAALFALVFVALFMGIRKLKRSNKTLRNIKISENDAFALSVVNTVIMLLPLTYLGRNDGAFISYFLQLWLHSVAVIAFISLERLKPEKYEYIYAVLYAAIAMFTIYFGMGKLPQHILTDEEIAVWQKAYGYIWEYGKNGDVFYARCLAYDNFADDRGDCICGHDAEVSEQTEKAVESVGFSTQWFPYVDELVEQNMDYRNSILDKAENHEYSLITIDVDGDYHLLDEDNSRQYGYSLIDALDLRVGNATYKTVFYGLR